MAARIAVLASGGGTNLQAIVDYHARHSATVAGSIALVGANQESAGALERARESAIPTVVFDASDGGESLLAALALHSIDLVVLAGYVKHIPPAVVRRYHGRIINIHPGLLPDFGGPGMYGARVHAAVIASGATVTGVTVHFVDDQLDHGPVIAQWRVHVTVDDTAESLAARVLAVEHLVYPRIVDMVAALHATAHSPVL